MKRTLFIVLFCVAYDIFAFVYGWSTGTDNMFSSLLLPILFAGLLYTGMVYYVTSSTAIGKKSMTLQILLNLPIYAYILLHAIILVVGISTVFENL
jgi:hypothetical protein